jgi:predicted AAA+ superfamily ATPase
MQQINEISNRLIRSVSLDFKRSLYANINWEERLIEIRGARGVGKTTLMLQKAKELSDKKESVLYVSTDIPYFFKNNLFDTADTFYKYGGKYLFMDEVHKYPHKNKGDDWSREIKAIYDAFPSLHVIFSGSSILRLFTGSGDLSRRKTSYPLKGLSFREYLNFYKRKDLPIVSISDILTNHTDISSRIINEIKILPEFQNYLTHGYYPFYSESPAGYYDKISEMINVVINVDIPTVCDISFETSHKMKQLLAVISTSVPYTPNLSNIGTELYITDQRTLIKYLNLLEKADLISTLGAKVTGTRIMNKPQKIYLNNSNLLYALAGSSVQSGTVRETFFLNQLNATHSVSYPKQSDFLVDNKYLFEIGGKKKSKKQLQNSENAFIAADDIEIGFDNKIPLWLFGFLY